MNSGNDIKKSDREKKKELKQLARERMARAEEENRIQDVEDKLDYGRVRKDRKDPSRLP